MFNEEYHIQVALVYWLRTRHPEVLFTIAPSGMKLPISVATKFKRMGYSKGTPDLMIFETRRGYPGLFIELKSVKGRLQPEQKEWLKALEIRGYKTAVCRCCEDAIVEIENYLK